MSIHFKLNKKPAGFVLNFATRGDQVQVMSTELISPLDSNHLIQRLEQMQGMIFASIPNLPAPSMIDHLLIIINPDLSGIAYVNELSIQAMIKINRDVEKGSPIYKSDIKDIDSVNLGVDVPVDAGVIVMRSLGWKKSLFYDFGPLQIEGEKRSFRIEQVLAKQALLLLGLQPIEYSDLDAQSRETQLRKMSNGFELLDQYLKSKCTEESKYQELFEEHPWMFGGQYKLVERHTSLNDENIPDFTAVRCHDSYRDIIEIKQPFLPCFKQKDNFASGFNDSWNQAERYLNFVSKQRNYLRDEKELLFENPKCSLIIGHDLTESQLKMIREKESLSNSITVYTYNHIQRTASHILNLMLSAGSYQL